MKRYAVIVAAGTGSRMNAGLPKQYMILSGKPVLFYSLQAYYQHDPDTKLVLVLAKDQVARWKQLCQDFNITVPHAVTEGGSTRTESVRNGLLLTGKGLISIHDGARPLVSTELIEACFESALQHGSGVAAVVPKDSIRTLTETKNAAADREKYRLIQTPQTFESATLLKAFEKCKSENSTDDATIFEKAGYNVVLVNGSYQNIKITTPEDLIFAEMLMNL